VLRVVSEAEISAFIADVLSDVLGLMLGLQQVLRALAVSYVQQQDS